MSNSTVVTNPKSSRRRRVLAVVVPVATEQTAVPSFDTSLAVDPRRLIVSKLQMLLCSDPLRLPLMADVRELRRLLDVMDPRLVDEAYAYALELALAVPVPTDVQSSTVTDAVSSVTVSSEEAALPKGA